MDHKIEYLKYSKKYRNLINKMQFGGGTARIYLATDRFDIKNQLLRSGEFKPSEEVLYPAELIDKYASIERINQQAVELRTDFNLTRFVQLYDNIGAYFICSDEIVNMWNRIATDLNIDISIFNGDNSVLRNEIIYDLSTKRYKDNEKFVVGLNIIATCCSEERCKKLNEQFNSIGKYFMGFNGYKHNYSSSFYICKDAFKLTSDEYNEKFDALGEIPPIIKLIKIFHSEFRECSDADCRHCSEINIDQVIAKIRSVMDKIISGRGAAGVYIPFNPKHKDHYINSDFGEKCTADKCLEDKRYIEYIQTKLEESIPIMAERRAAGIVSEDTVPPSGPEASGPASEAPASEAPMTEEMRAALDEHRRMIEETNPEESERQARLRQDELNTLMAGIEERRRQTELRKNEILERLRTSVDNEIKDQITDFILDLNKYNNTFSFNSYEIRHDTIHNIVSVIIRKVTGQDKYIVEVLTKDEEVFYFDTIEFEQVDQNGKKIVEEEYGYEYTEDNPEEE